METNRQKPVGWDKGSLTEQQTKGTGTTMIQIRGIHKMNQQNRAALSPGLNRCCALPSHETVPAAQLPPSIGTQHDGTWYGTPCSVWPGGVSPPSCAPSWIPVKINPVLAKPRTIAYSVLFFSKIVLLLWSIQC